MAVNLASKFSPKVVEAYKKAAFTEVGVNQDYDWAGVKTITVYTVNTVDLEDYTRSGTARYGTMTELGDTTQELTLANDRGFTFSIDQGNQTEQMMIKREGRALRRQIDLKITPEIDKYRLNKMSAGAIANSSYASGAISKTNAYSSFLAGQEKLDDALVTTEGRVAFVKPSFYNFIKQDASFTLASEMNAKKLEKGVMGEIDGVKIVKSPTSYMPTDNEFILVHPDATVAPIKLKSYVTHTNPIGVNGKVVEGRVIYDAFVLETVKDGLYTHLASAPSV